MKFLLFERLEMFKINLCHRDEILGGKVDCFAVRFDDQSLSRGREKRENVKRIEEEEREAFFLSLHLRYPRLFPPPLTLAPEVRSHNT